jgi:putative DNA primase/helicase
MRPEADREAAAVLDQYVAANRGLMVKEPLPAEFTEDALALEFSRRHRGEVLYVHEWGKWLRWDGTRWAQERTLRVYDLARELTRDVAGATRGTSGSREKVRWREYPAPTQRLRPLLLA